eukprot:m.173519 g.173519  ORF g.173519 m.173519 type:complete len:709 (+) comp31726_c4_seq1:17-2143(+)
MSKLSTCMAIMVVFCAACWSTNAITIDVEPGTPLRDAQAKAQAVAKTGVRVTLRLHAGTHDLHDGPLFLTAKDAGITWEGVPGAVISGGVSLKRNAFTPVSASDPIWSRLSSSAKQQVIATNVSAFRGCFTRPRSRGNIGGCSPIMELFEEDGTPLRVARWPNDDWVLTQSGSNATGFQTPTDVPHIALPTPGTPTNNTLLAAGYWWYDWSDATIVVSALQSTGFATVRTQDQPHYVSAKGNFPIGSRFFLLNQPELLDVAGEYWLDQDHGMLYVYPSSPTWPGGVLSTATTLFEFQSGGTPWSGLTFQGLELIAAQDTAFHCATCIASDIVIQSCNLTGFGVGAISIDGGTNWTINKVAVTNTGGTAVRLRGGNRTTLAPANHAITDSTISNFSRTCFTYQPGVNLGGVGCTASNNEISNGPHQGLLWGGNNHVISQNVIHDVVLESFDSAAIYASDRDWSMRGTIIRHNLIFNLGLVTTKCNTRTSCNIHAIYLDALQDGFTVDGNVVVQSDAIAATNHGQGIINNGGRDDTLVNNMCVGWDVCVASQDCGLTWYAPTQNKYVAQLAKLHAAQTLPMYRMQYPAMTKINSNEIAMPLLGKCSNDATCGPGPWGNTVLNNVAVNASDACVLLPAETEFPNDRFNFSARKNLEFNGSASSLGFTSSDPAGVRCWQLKNDSPLYSGGFGTLPMGLFGSSQWRLRWPCPS